MNLTPFFLVGRFVGMDLFPGYSDSPASLHKYTYVHVDPINGIDPSGLLLVENAVNQAALATLVRGAITRVIQSQGKRKLKTLVARKLFKVVATAAVVSASAAYFLRTTVEECVRRGESCDFGKAVLSHGSELPGHADHIFQSQLGNGSNHRPTAQFLNRRSAPDREKPWEGIWYDYTPQCNKWSARPAYGQPATCDEYPFHSTSQGGVINYLLGGVSLQLLPKAEQTIQRDLIRMFYQGAQISNNSSSDESEFYSTANSANPSYYITRDGQVVYPFGGH